MATSISPEQQTQTALPPGPQPLPVVGNALAFRRDQLGYLQQLQRTYGDMATIHIGNTPVVLLFRPEHVRYVLVENPRNFTSREITGNLAQIIGDGLLTIDGEAHRQQRRMVQPAFHKKRVEGYVSVMTQYTQEMLKTWHVGDQINMSHAMQMLTLRIVCKCLFNADMSEEINALGSAFTSMTGNPATLLEGFLNIQLDQPFTAYGRRMDAKRRVDEFIYRLIAQRRADSSDVGDVLSMLLAGQEGEEGLTDTQVRDHIMTFVAAGHETTALSLVWAFYLLSQHPEVREKVQAELQTVLGKRDPVLQDMANLPYTEWVLQETMRLYPPAWTQGRHAIAAFELDGIHFPAGTLVMFSQWVIQRLPEVWGDPDEFRPERWDPVNGQKIPQWAYFPFGGGPRICIGMPFAQLEAKLLLTTILQHYSPKVLPGYKLELNPLITLRPKHDLHTVLLPVMSAEETKNWERVVYTSAEAQARAVGAERQGCRTALSSLFGLFL